jgi:hypothetical protein
MNRHERRKQRATERKARRKPEKRAMPPEYYEQIEVAAKACFDWIQTHPGAQLKWHPPAQDGVLMIAALDAGAKYLADSPDAFALLADVDAATGRKLTIYQAAWALRRIRALPMPDGSYHGTEVKHESEAYRALMRFADGPDESDRVPPAPCGHCGKVLDGATPGDAGGGPKTGDLAVCVYCCGVSTFEAGLQVPLSDEEIEALPARVRDQLREMQALLRQALSKGLGGQRRGPGAEA